MGGVLFSAAGPDGMSVCFLGKRRPRRKGVVWDFRQRLFSMAGLSRVGSKTKTYQIFTNSRLRRWERGGVCVNNPAATGRFVREGAGNVHIFLSKKGSGARSQPYKKVDFLAL